MTLRDQLLRDEGLRLRAYQDSRGIWTIGVGHNLEARSITRAVALQILDDDLADTERTLTLVLPWARALDEPRWAVLVNMSFNLGTGGLLTFRQMLAALRAHDYATAAAEMLDSMWAQQVGARAQRLAEQMRTGAWT